MSQVFEVWFTLLWTVDPPTVDISINDAADERTGKTMIKWWYPPSPKAMAGKLSEHIKCRLVVLG